MSCAGLALAVLAQGSSRLEVQALSRRLPQDMWARNYGLAVDVGVCV